MNGIQLRKTNVPLTPNLEQYKQKNKSKSRRKPYSIQPTNPPTPKIHKAHITLKPTQDKPDGKDQPVYCPVHPERLATRFFDATNKSRICSKCYLLHNDNEENQEEVQYQKRRELEEFKIKIKSFGLKLEEADSYIREWGFISDQNFYRQREYIHQSFEALRNALDQKERELLNGLIAAQQQIKRSMVRSGGQVEEIKKAITRYIKQIDTNYEDIIESLPYDKFAEIIDKYNCKIRYYDQGVEEICLDGSLNVYIPRKDIERCVEKSSVQVYPEMGEEETPQNRTLQRYTTEKNNLYVEGRQGYLSGHQESVGHNKISQHRQSRDREYFCNSRGMGGKENANFDNYIFH